MTLETQKELTVKYQRFYECVTSSIKVGKIMILSLMALQYVQD